MKYYELSNPDLVSGFFFCSGILMFINPARGRDRPEEYFVHFQIPIALLRNFRSLSEKRYMKKTQIKNSKNDLVKKYEGARPTSNGMKSPDIIIYTDGSSRGNPGPGGWGCIIATKERVTELGHGDKHTTNNKMELMAAIKALSFVEDLGDAFTIDVRADSSYVINGITKWVFGWQKNGWKNSKKEEVLNRDLWEALALAVSDLQMSGCKILWSYTQAHVGIPGNERADEIATMCADGEKVKLFDGARWEYEVDLVSTEPTGDIKKRTKSPEEKARQKMKAYSYLSLVKGKLYKDATWSECEKRVKGVPGVKFKKSVSAVDESAIIKTWGAD